MTYNFNKIRRRLLMAIGMLPAHGFVMAKRDATLNDRDHVHAYILTKIIKDHTSAKIIGNSYIKSLHNEITMNQVLNNIYTEYPKLKIHMINNNTNLDSLIRNLQREDFNKKRTIIIDGWVLSKLEVQLYTLTTFL